MIIDNRKLDRILECTNLDKYELIDLPMEQHDDSDDSSQEHTDVGMAPTWILKGHRGSHLVNEVYYMSYGCYIIVLDYKTVALRMVSTSW